jgi:hypothetical protein
MILFEGRQASPVCASVGSSLKKKLCMGHSWGGAKGTGELLEEKSVPVHFVHHRSHGLARY